MGTHVQGGISSNRWAKSPSAKLHQPLVPLGSLESSREDHLRGLKRSEAQHNNL